MNPLSPVYYIKENKFRTALLVILLMCTVLLSLAGNYISSLRYYWLKNEEYDAKICMIGADPTEYPINMEMKTAMANKAANILTKEWILTYLLFPI